MSGHVLKRPVPNTRKKPLPVWARRRRLRLKSCMGEEAPLPRLAGTPHRILLAVLALVVLVVLAMGIGELAGYRTAGDTASSYTEASA